MNYKFITIVVSVVLLLSCSQAKKTDIATVSGKVSGFIPVSQNNATVIRLTVTDVILGEDVEYETLTGKDGIFSFSIPVISKSIGRIGINAESYYLAYISLTPMEESKFEVFFDEKGDKQVNILKGSGFTKSDLEDISTVSMQVLEAYQNRASGKQSFSPDIAPEAYKKDIIDEWDELLSIVDNDKNLPAESKTFIRLPIKLFYLKNDLLDYKNAMHDRYCLLHDNEEKFNADDFTPIIPQKSYYSFLKDFDLNAIQYVFTNDYYAALQSILYQEGLNIPAIGDTPVKVWIEAVKANISDLMGSDSGLFYDLLAAHAYIKQFNADKTPLSKQQEENIKAYFSNKRFVEVLLSKNEKCIGINEDIVALENNKKNTEKIVLPLTINETPSVSKEELMNAIILKYKGKAVVIDFWATWCAPCLNAMEKTKYFKHEIRDKNVVFVYITDASSPVEEWKEKIKEIGGEHYYLTEEEWNYLSKTIRFSSIPTYLYYNKNGLLKNKIISFSSSREMRKMIEELL
ncbi:MAG: TlpA family protein disulfide reductase [Candidatus Symbiothrix sp.]|jgi:thiol-disulfide isomerase/thioredoxin|nr:TlpA family protein disulfide reductase [Candidatus Symbiothrix sp.]